jgi:hypothetical protein
MHKAALNPNLIRPLLIVLFLVIMQVLRAVKSSKTPKPAPRPGTGNGISSGTASPEAIPQKVDPPRLRKNEWTANAGLFTMSEKIQQPPKIEPESSFVPSLLLLALLVCLGIMAYQYLAR